MRVSPGLSTLAISRVIAPVPGPTSRIFQGALSTRKVAQMARAKYLLLGSIAPVVLNLPTTSLMKLRVSFNGAQDAFLFFERGGFTFQIASAYTL